MTFVLPDRENKDDSFFVWLHATLNINDADYYYTISGFAINIQYYIFYIMIILIYVILTIAVCTIIYSGFIKRNINVLSGMLGTTSRFHFIPLFLITGNFILGEALDEHTNLKDGHFITSIILAVFALISLIFISFQTKTQLSFTVEMAIIKAAYSCFIAFLTYYLVYIIWYYRFFRFFKDNEEIEEDEEDIIEWNKNCAIAGSIAIGLLNNIFSILLKAPVISLINCLICCGKTIHFFQIEKNLRKYIYDNNASGIIDIGMGVASALIMFLLYLNLMSMKNRPQIS